MYKMIENEDFSVDRSVICRTCLIAGRETMHMDDRLPVTSKMPNMDKTFSESLYIILRKHVTDYTLEEGRKYPQRICMHCSRLLQITLYFLRLGCKSVLILRKRAANIAQTQLVQSINAIAIESNYNLHEQSFDVGTLDEPINQNSFRNHEGIPTDDRSGETMQVNIIVQSTSTDYEVNNEYEDTKKYFDVVEIEKKISGDFNANGSTFEISENPVEDENESSYQKREKLSCSKCDETFNNAVEFDKHKNAHKKIKPFFCEHCKYSTCYMESMRKHYKHEHKIVVEGDTILACLRNEKKSKKSILGEAVDLQECTYNCACCLFKCYTEKDIEAHMTTEHAMLGENSKQFSMVYNCPICYRAFKDRKGMRTHFTLQHGVKKAIKRKSDEIYPCQDCNRKLSSKAGLLLHQRVNHPRQDIECKRCAIKFATERLFEQHLNCVHNVEAVHECKLCCTSFETAQALSLHCKRHTERHFQCKMCPRSYISVHDLQKHIQQKHSTQEKIVCRVCHGGFSHAAHLQRHEEKEHIMQYFKCEFCTREYRSRSALYAHRLKHKGLPYQCTVCNREYMQRKDLSQHAEKEHKLQITDEELREMFRQKFGYTNRRDAFAKTYNVVEIADARQASVTSELEAFGLKFNNMCQNDFGELDADLPDEIFE